MGFSLQTAIQGASVVSFILTIGLIQASWKASRISYVRYWAGGLALVCIRYVLWMLEPIIGRPMSQFSGELAHCLAMYLIFFGSTRMTGARLSRKTIVLVFLVFGPWLAYTTLYRPDFMLRTVPVYVFAAASLFSSARLFWLLMKKHPGTGYGYACTAASLWGLHKLNYPALRPIPEIAPFGFMAAVALMTYLSITLLIIGQNRRRNLLDRLARAAAFNANHDLLTELPNRRYLMASITRRTYAKNEFHLLLIDLVNLGQLNDSWGRSVADKALVVAARRLEGMLEEKSLLARVGGKQFAILSEAATLPELMQSAEQTWRLPVIIDGHRISLEGRMGGCTFPEEGRSADQLYKHASLALTDAKNAGVNGRTFGDLKSTEVLRRMELKRDLYDATERGEIYCLYQPQYCLRTGAIKGAEALARWNHPRFGEVSPATFIPLAESSGAILRLGEHVLAEAVRSLAASPMAGTDFSIGVNLSPSQFTGQSVAGQLLSIVEDSGLSCSQIEFEITESTIFHDVDVVNRLLFQMGKTGLRFAIDDFGTGYSSMSILKALPVHRLKIDASFVRDMDKSHQDRSIVEMMVYLAHTLRLEVVAEGVETQSQYDLLKTIGCDQVQGFLLSRPVRFSELVSLVTKESEASTT